MRIYYIQSTLSGTSKTISLGHWFSNLATVQFTRELESTEAWVLTLDILIRVIEWYVHQNDPQIISVGNKFESRRSTLRFWLYSIQIAPPSIFPSATFVTITADKRIFTELELIGSCICYLLLFVYV